MKDVLSFNLQMFARYSTQTTTSVVKAGDYFYDSLQEAITSETSGTITFLANNTETVLISGETFTFDYSTATFTGAVTLENADLTIGTATTTALTFNGKYAVNATNNSTYALTNFDNADGVKDKVTAGGNFTSDFRFDTYTLSGLTATTNADEWSNTGTAFVWQNAVTAGATATANTISYIDSGTTPYFNITGITGTNGTSFSGTKLTLVEGVLGASDVTLTNESGSSYTLALDNNVSSPVSSTAQFTTIVDKAADYVTSGTTAGYTLGANSTTVAYTAAVATETMFSLSGIFDVSTNSVVVDGTTININSESALGNTNLLITNGSDTYNFKLADNIAAPVASDAYFTAVTNYSADYMSTSTTKGYALYGTKVVEYTAAVDPTAWFTLNNISDTGNGFVTVSGTEVKVFNAALIGSNVTLADTAGGGYKLALGNDVDSVTYVAEHFTTLADGSATYISASNNAGYTLNTETYLSIGYTAEVASETLFTLAGVADVGSNSVVVSANVVTLSETALKQANVYLTNAESQTYTLELADGIASSTYVDAAYGAIDSTSNTATYYGGYNTGGYNLSDSGLAITYTASETAVGLFTLTGVKSTDGLTPDASNTITVATANLIEGSNLKLTNESGTYTLALNSTVSAPVTYAEGLYSSTAKTAAWNNKHNTAGYSSTSVTEISYVSEVKAVDLIGVSEIDSFTETLINFSSASGTLAVNSANDVLKIKNTSGSETKVTQFGDDLIMSNADSIVADQYWAWQESNSGTLHYDSDVNLTNVSGINANTTGITRDGTTLILPTGVTVLDGSGTGKSQATGVTTVKVGTKTYDVENGYLVNEVVNSDVSVIKFNGSDVTLVNSEGATITDEEVSSGTYVSVSGGAATLLTAARQASITVENTGDNSVFVTSGNDVISLAKSQSVQGDASNLTGASSWKYSGNTLTNGGGGEVSLSGITLSDATVITATFSGSNAYIAGAGVSYRGVTTTSTDASISAASDAVTMLGGAANLATNSTVSVSDSATVSINDKGIIAGSGVAATMSTALTVEGNFTYKDADLAVESGSIAINNSSATDVTLNNSAVVSSSNSDVALSLATGAVVTINGVDGGLSATDTKITPVSGGVAFAPGTGTVALGEDTTFKGGKALISSSGEKTLFSDASVTSSATSQEFTVDKSANATPAYINGKALLVTGDSNVYVANTENGFEVENENINITGDSAYTVVAAKADIQGVTGISAGATIVPHAGEVSIITDNEGAFTIGERTVTVSGDTLVAFGASDSVLTSVSSLDGAIAGNFNDAVTIDGGKVQISGDNEVTVTGADTVLTAISGVGGGDPVTVASAGGATTITTDANGTFQFGSAQSFAVNESDESVNFLMSASSDVSVTGIDAVANGTVAFYQDSSIGVNGNDITVSGGVSSDAAVTVTTADSAITSVEGLFGLINGLTGQTTVNAVDSDVTVNSAAIQINEGNSTTFDVQLESGTVKAVTGINAGATITTANNVSVVTSEQGTFTFPNGVFNVTDTDGVSFVTDANSNVVDIQGFSGTLTSNQNNVTVNGAAVYTSNTDASLISSGNGVGTISGLKNGNAVTAPDGTQVMMPADSELTVNNRKYTLAGDADGVSISGSTQPTVGGLDSGAVLEVTNGGTYNVNNTVLQAVNGSKIIGDPEGTAHIFELSDIDFESDTKVDSIIEAVTGISATDTKQTTVATDSTIGQSLNEGNTSGADGNLKVTLTNTNTDTETAQAVNFASNTGVKNATLESGNQDLTFNNEGGNIAVVGSKATGHKNITLGNGGDLVLVEGETGAEVTVKTGTGDDTIVTAGNAVTADLSAGGATRVMATAGNTTLGNYNATTGAGIQVTNSDIYQSVKNNIIALGDGAVAVKNAVITTDVNASPEGSSVINFFDLKGQKYQVGYTHSGGGEVDLSASKEGVILKGNYSGGSSNNVLRGGNGDDSILAGANDIVDAGAGVNQIDITSDTSGVTTVRQTAESGRTTVTGFGFGFGENQDRVSISNVETAEVEYNSSNGKVTFSRGNAKLIVTGSSSSADLASSSDLTNDGASQQILLGEGDNVVKLEVAEKNAVISVSDNSDNRATAYRGNNSGLNFSNVTDNISIILSPNIQTALNATGSSIGVDAVDIKGFNKFQGGSGNNTLVGADDTNNTLVAGTGNTSIYGGTGLGADSLVGAVSSLKSGSTTFFFVDNSGKDTISNFEFLASDKDNATSSDRINFVNSNIVNATVSENNVVVELSNIEDRLTIENGRGKNIQVVIGGNNYVANLDTTSLTYDGTANFFMATGKNATVNVSADVPAGAAILLDENFGDVRSDARFVGNIKELNASSMDGRAILGGNVNDNVIRAAQGDSTLWGGSHVESNDSLIGGNGHDTFYYGKGQGNDRVIGADGNDMVYLYDYTLDDIAAYDVTSTAIALADKNGGTLTVENAGTSGVNFRLSDGTTFVYDSTDQEWDIKQ